MKRIWKGFILFALAMLLASCAIQTVEQYESMRDEERSVEGPEATAQNKAEQDTKTETQSEAVKADESSKQQDELVSSPSDEAPPEKGQGDFPAAESSKDPSKDTDTDKGIPTESPKQTEISTILPPPKPTATTIIQPSPKPTSPSKPDESDPALPSKRHVTIAIYADKLLDNWDMLDKALQDEKYVPKDGVILAEAKYELLSEKETVWDVLLRASKEHKIQLEYQGASSTIYNSVYVEGINHLYEFSAGSLSGWMYQVNDVFPSIGCDQYVLEDGDVIEWHFTVDLGRDLGAGV